MAALRPSRIPVGGFDNVTANVSSGSPSVSLKTATITKRLVAPAGSVTVPSLFERKSTPFPGCAPPIADTPVTE